MSSPYASPQAVDTPIRGIAWVLRGAAALMAIAAWLVLLLHVLLLVRAEHRLDQVVSDANRFAQLPGMTSAELTNYTQRLLAENGLQGKVQLGSYPRTSPRFMVDEIQAKPSGGVLQLTGQVAGWFTEPTQIKIGGSRDSRLPLLKAE